MDPDHTWADLWKQFGSLYCINLIDNNERHESSGKIFQEYSMPVEYYRPMKHPKGGAVGCYESHIAVIRKAYESGAETALILEDDLLPVQNRLNKAALCEILDFMRTSTDWGIMFLGCFHISMQFKTERTQFPHIFKVHAVLTHAYVINRKHMERMLALNQHYRQTFIDHVYKAELCNYAYMPTLFHQDESPSSIQMQIDTFGFKNCIIDASNAYGTSINIPMIHLLPALILLLFVSMKIFPQLDILHVTLLVLILAILVSIATWG